MPSNNFLSSLKKTAVILSPTKYIHVATGSELIEMAKYRLEESELLYRQGYYSGSYYLAGYAVEFGLKAVICKKLGVDIFEYNPVKGPVSSNAVKAFQIHDIPTLVLLSGLHPELETKMLAQSHFYKAWLIVSAWNEQRRYKKNCNQQTAASFLKQIKLIMKWIERHW